MPSNRPGFGKAVIPVAKAQPVPEDFSVKKAAYEELKRLGIDEDKWQSILNPVEIKDLGTFKSGFTEMDAEIMDKLGVIPAWVE